MQKSKSFLYGGDFMNLKEHSTVEPLYFFTDKDIATHFLLHLSGLFENLNVVELPSIAESSNESDKDLNVMIAIFNTFAKPFYEINTGKLDSSILFTSRHFLTHVIFSGELLLSRPLFVQRSFSGSSLYVLYRSYLVSYSERNNLQRSHFFLLMHIFVLIQYLPLMLLQSKKQKAIFGFHSETGKPLTQSIKITLPTFDFISRFSQEFFRENHLLCIGNEAMLKALLTGYFSLSLATLAGTLTEKDVDLIPSVWAYRLSNAFLSVPKVVGTVTSMIAFINDNRVYPTPIDGVTVTCNGYGDLKSIFFKEKAYLHDDDSVVLFCKLTYADGLGDLLAFSLTHGYLLNSYDGLLKSVTNLGYLVNIVLKVYHDFTCLKPSNRTFDTRKNQMVLGFASQDSTNELIVYLPRSVSNYYKALHDQEDAALSGPKGVKRPHFVDMHTRRLPVGMQASDRAREMAKLFGISLPLGRTFVAPYNTGSGEELKMLTKPIKRYISKYE